MRRCEVAVSEGNRWYSGLVRRLILAVGISVFVACPKPSEPVDAGAPVVVADASVDAGQIDGSTAADAGDAGPPRFSFALSARSDAGVETITVVNEAAELDSASSLKLEIPVKLKDFRVRLFDDHEQVVPSDDVADVDDAGVRYQADLLQPLRSGRAYTLMIDAEVGPELRDDLGRAWDDVRLSLKVRGEIQPEPGAAKKPGKPSKKR
jgi:hypothetical protein